MLLLGQGGSGETYVVQKLIFPVVLLIWLPKEGRETLRVVAARNLQAKNISTASVAATTLRAPAACVRVQKLANARMRAGAAEIMLVRNWRSCRVLIMEEISMISALLFSMLDFRSMPGRRESRLLSPDECHRTGNASGRSPIVLYLGDFLQLRPTGQLSLVADLDEKDEQGNCIFTDVPLEVQAAQRVFGRAHDVFELRGTMRVVPGDPLVGLLQCVLDGSRFLDQVWTAFRARCASAENGVLDERVLEENFRSGYCLLIHWGTRNRMMNRRAILDVPGAACDAAVFG